MPEAGPARILPTWLKVIAVGVGAVLVVVLVVGTVIVLGATIRAALRRR